MIRDLADCGNKESWNLYNDLRKKLAYDGSALFEEEYEGMGTIMVRLSGSDDWEVVCHNPYAPMWGGDPRIIKKIEDSKE